MGRRRPVVEERGHSACSLAAKMILISGGLSGCGGSQLSYLCLALAQVHDRVTPGPQTAWGDDRAAPQNFHAGTFAAHDQARSVGSDQLRDRLTAVGSKSLVDGRRPYQEHEIAVVQLAQHLEAVLGLPAGVGEPALLVTRRAWIIADLAPEAGEHELAGSLRRGAVNPAHMRVGSLDVERLPQMVF